MKLGLFFPSHKINLESFVSSSLNTSFRNLGPFLLSSFKATLGWWGCLRHQLSHDIFWEDVNISLPLLSKLPQQNDVSFINLTSKLSQQDRSTLRHSWFIIKRLRSSSPLLLKASTRSWTISPLPSKLSQQDMSTFYPTTLYLHLSKSRLPWAVETSFDPFKSGVSFVSPFLEIFCEDLVATIIFLSLFCRTLAKWKYTIWAKKAHIFCGSSHFCLVISLSTYKKKVFKLDKKNHSYSSGKSHLFLAILLRTYENKSIQIVI